MSVIKKIKLKKWINFSTFFVCFILTFLNPYSIYGDDSVLIAEELEAIGDYGTAVDVFRSNYHLAIKKGLVEEANSHFQNVERLEEKLRNLGLSRRLFDEKNQPRAKLVNLLNLVGMDSLNASEMTITKINAWAQKNLLRADERWKQQKDSFESLKSLLIPFLCELGFVYPSFPHFKEYQGALLLGGFLSVTRLRLNYLVEQWQQGVRFSDIYFLSGERPLVDVEIDNLYIKDESSPFKIRNDWSKPFTLPATECEMARLVWDQADIPESMRQKVKVHFINVPMQKNPHNNKLLRPTTDDTIEHWLALKPAQGCYLTISNAPYTNRQDLVIRSISPKGYTFDSIGYGVSENERIAIFLDEVARCIFHTKIFLELNKGPL